MTTNKERAAAYRKIAYLYESIGKDAQARVNRNCADALDPPKPEYPDGTIAWVTRNAGYRSIASYDASNAVWIDDWDSFGVSLNHYYEPIKVEPLRVLADDEIAVKRINTVADNLRLRVKFNKRDNRVSLSVNDERVLSAYADALDAEAGEQS